MTTQFDQRRTWIGLFAAFFALTGVLRAFTGHALDVDQAEIMRHAQALQWGYAGEAPLYPWLQWAVFQMTGPGQAGLMLLKSFLLWLTPTLLLLLLSQSLPVRDAGLATLALVLVPSISFYSQPMLACEVLALDMALVFALLLWVILRGSAHPSDWLSLGFVLGLGLLSMPGFALVPVVMVAAAASLAKLRRGLRWQGLGLTLAMAGLLCLGPVIWTLTHPTGFAPLWTSDGRVAGTIWQIGRGVLVFQVIAVLAIVGAAALARARGPAQVPGRTGDEHLMQVWLWRYTLAALAVTCAGLVWLRPPVVSAHMFQMSLVFVSPLLMLWLLPRLGEVLRLGVTWALLVVAGVVGGAVSFQDAVVPSRRTAAFETIAPQLVSLLPPDAVLVGDGWLLGNLVLQDPSLAVLPAHARPDPAGQAVFVWQPVSSGASGPAQLSAQIGAGWTLGPPLATLAAPSLVPQGEEFLISAARILPVVDQTAD